ncbi:probable carotenoid cleavage dioxygenase 4, chloroplastic [Magnolia sinica]|uniref:probable carotenoid cleavage dioxygenase 4, chloroplastic n=1 Tax=Magnolia sinica TaxID=86752 RepID=UPI00265855AE|nr:probable carotenoid cleavage dioxygenase 4, chloroplastic [Magnolia sinica]
MYSFSSSLFSNRFLQRSTLSPPPPPHILKVSSVRIEEKPQNPQSPPPSPPVYKPNGTSAPQVPQVSSSKPSSSSSSSSSSASANKIKRFSQPSLPSTFCNVFDDIINKFIDPPIRPSVDPKYVLADNFAPVNELPPTECPVIKGELPPCLDGAYIRNGPNPQYLPRGPHHLFDGDGMLHSLRISKGRATFCSRYVKTYKFNLENQAGSPIFPNFFSGFYNLPGAATRGIVTAARVVTGQFNPTGGVGLANTSLVFFGKRLFALGESDLPYTVRLTEEGDIETVGRCDFDGKLFMGMTAHPKVDPDTGEIFAFRYGPVPPFLTLFRFDAEGSKKPDVPIFSMVQPTLLHDFAITKRYAIVPDIQVVMKPIDMIVGSGSPVGSDPQKVPRIGVIPRNATTESEIRWFNVPGFNIMHTINAWDDEDAIVLVAPNILSIEHALEQMELVHCTVEMVRIEIKSGKVTRRTISSRNLDFGVINPSYVGKKNRYAYMGLGDPMPKISGVVKLDYGNNGVKEAVRNYGDGCFGGEPFFVAKDPDNEEAEEDDGYVVSYVHDEKRGESRFVVMDAQSPTLDIVASVKLPRRVPYGFHGLFVSERDLTKQLPHH